MKAVNLKILLLAALATTLAAGCGKRNDTAPTSPAENPAAPSEPSQTPQPDEAQGYRVKCKKDAVFAPPTGTPMSQDELKNSFQGKFEIDQVHIHHKATSKDGKYIGAFYGVVTRYISDKPYMEVKNIRETDLKISCDEYNPDSGVPFLTGLNIPVASLIHLPSGRITVFDENDRLDNPEFNMPLLAEVHFDSLGNAHYKNAVSNPKPPYLTNRYLNDVIKKYFVEPKIYSRANGGFEIRVSWQDLKGIKEGYSFWADTDVVITYKRSE